MSLTEFSQILDKIPPPHRKTLSCFYTKEKFKRSTNITTSYSVQG